MYDNNYTSMSYELTAVDDSALQLARGAFIDCLRNALHAARLLACAATGFGGAQAPMRQQGSVETVQLTVQLQASQPGWPDGGLLGTKLLSMLATMGCCRTPATSGCCNQLSICVGLIWMRCCPTATKSATATHTTLSEVSAFMMAGEVCRWWCIICEPIWFSERKKKAEGLGSSQAGRHARWELPLLGQLKP